MMVNSCRRLIISLSAKATRRYKTFKLIVLASGFSKLFTTREAAERFAELILGLKQRAFRVDAIA
jgi:hypothetical protein